MGHPDFKVRMGDNIFFPSSTALQSQVCALYFLYRTHKHAGCKGHPVAGELPTGEFGERLWSGFGECLPLSHLGAWDLFTLPKWVCCPVTPQTWPSTILVVSHDRNFLNAIATDIIHLHSQRLDGYRGDFETFIKSKQERLLNQQREYEAQQQYRQHIQVWGRQGCESHPMVSVVVSKGVWPMLALLLQVFIDRFRYNANRASQVQSKLKMLEKLWVQCPWPGPDSCFLHFFPHFAGYLCFPILGLLWLAGNFDFLPCRKAESILYCSWMVNFAFF